MQAPDPHLADRRRMVDEQIRSRGVHDERVLAAMERVRRAFDPKRMLNPGKVLPGPKVCAEAVRRDDFLAVEGGGHGGR